VGRLSAHKLFSKLSDDLATINVKYRGLVACPLCLRLFAEEGIDIEEPELTEEHIIPRELGGNIKTLTCKLCNNLHGSQIDAHLVQMLRSRDSIEGLSNRPFRGRIEIAGMRVPTNIDWKASVGKMTTFGLRQFKPAVHEAIREKMRSGIVKTMNVTLIFDFIPGRANIGLLRIAYLAMFREFGYGYILSPAAAAIRGIINTFDKCPAEVGRFVGQVGGQPERFGKPLQLLKIRGGIAIMVVATLVTETKRYYAAFMPSPELPPESVIATLCDAAQSVTRRPSLET
jgi:hypothetical protein